MKIVNIMLSKGRGGLEQVALDYHQALAFKGHRVKTIMRRGASIDYSILPEGEVELVKLPKNVPLLSGFAKKKLCRMVRDFQADALLLHGNRPVEYLYDQDGLGARIFIAHNYKAKPTITNLEGVIAVSQPVGNHIETMGFDARNIHIVNNMSRLQYVERKPQMSSPPMLGMLTRLHHVKGVDLFIAALKQLADEGCDFKAIIGGEGPDRQSLMQQVKDHGLQKLVTFAGWVEEKENFLGEIDILVAPSRSEAFPITIIEALTVGVGLVISDNEGPLSVIEHENQALVVPREDVNAITLAIKHYLNDPALFKKILDNQKILAQNFTFNAISCELEQAIKKIHTSLV